MLDTPLMSLLETSLDYASTQQAAISSNLANVNTPGYTRKDASFATVLEQASDSGSNPETALPMNAPGGGVLSSESDDRGSVPIVSDTSSPMRVDGNNIDIDTEMTNLAKNQIYYQAVSQFIGQDLSDLKYVVGGG
jgi:flagellar basal-body rod protein FlgB